MADQHFHNQELSLTDYGWKVLSEGSHYGAGDYQSRWIGGVEVSKASLLCWDYSRSCIEVWSEANS